MENGVNLPNITPTEVPNTLLIVDDSMLNRVILANIFEQKYQILEAENGREGFDIILEQGQSICAILLDVVMPEMDGIQVLTAMKERGLLSQIPVFLITADTRDEIMRQAYELGVMDVINKPVVPYVVERRVDSVVELFQARRRLGNVVEQQRDKLLLQAQQLFQMSLGMVESLSAAIEFRSDESGEHVRRIHDITTYILRNTPLGEGLTEEQINLIGMAAITHDVGKIAIPDAILNKPGRFTPEEFEVMKTHTIQGAHLLSQIPQMKEHGAYEYAYDIALHHHERWDGKGYPEGLKGDEISIWAQIVSLADVYDALVSKRCYKSAYGYDEAVQMIQEGQCGCFNPELLKYFWQVEGNIRAFYQKKKALNQE